MSGGEVSQLMPFGSLLARLRREAGLSQERLAQSAGISLTYLRGLEKGERLATPGTVRRLSREIGCSPDPLLRQLTPRTS